MALAAVAGCTVKGVEVPSLAGPSTFARSILLKAEKDTLLQNGVDSARITVTATGINGQSEAVSVRAQIVVDGIAQDFGILSSKNFVTPSTLTYTAPAASPNTGAQTSQTVTIAVTPTDSGDFRSEFSRTIDLRLIPPGVILPTNPNLVPAFVVTPSSPRAFTTASFDASTTTNNGVACGNACSYGWSFGDATTGTGISTTHQFRSVGNYQVALTVTDGRGAQATTIQTLAVTPSTPPTAAFTFSPPSPATAQDIFFNAQTSAPAAGRTIANYGWDFGDGSTASGVTVAKRYALRGTYNVTLTVTDDAGSTALATQAVTVGAAGTGPTAVLTFSPTAGTRVGTTVFFDGSASTPGPSPIRTYRFDYGDGNNDVGEASRQSHVYSAAGTFLVRLTVTDTEGRTATTTASVTIAP
jgi:PKD repeat protein